MDDLRALICSWIAFWVILKYFKVNILLKKGFRKSLLRNIDTFLKKINDAVHIPVIASGGAGSVQHFVDVFEQTNVDAALAASVFHYGEILIPDLKEVLRKNNIEVREQ